MDSYDEVTCKVETDRTPDLESSLTQTNSSTGVLRLWTTVSVRPILSNNGQQHFGKEWRVGVCTCVLGNDPCSWGY